MDINPNKIISKTSSEKVLQTTANTVCFATTPHHIMHSDIMCRKIVKTNFAQPLAIC